MGVTSSLPHGKPWRATIGKPAVLWALLLALPLLAVMAFAVFQPVKVRPRMGLAPGFALTDQNGNRLTNEDLRGKLVLYNFLYTGCTAPCAGMTTTMQAVQGMLGQVDTAGIPVELVTISIDPDRDTPAQLQAFASSIGADTTKWHFLTGEATRLKNVVGGGFRVFYQPDGDGSYTIDPQFVLVDGNGITRARYQTATPDLGVIERDLKLVVDEVRNSDGPGKLVYEAAHLFLCYPGQYGGNRLYGGLAIALVLLCTAAAVSFGQRTSKPQYGIPFDAGARVDNFTLDSTLDRQISLGDFQGKTVLLYFGYTTCPDICPTTLSELKDALAQLGDRASQVQVLFVSVDPERDTPERLASYLKYFDPSFIGLTGSLDQIAAVATRFGIYFSKHAGASAADYFVDHTSTVLVIDSKGYLRLLFPNGVSGEQMASDVRKMMQ